MGWFQKLVYGVDLDEEQRLQDELDQKNAVLNSQRLAEGLWQKEQYDLAQKQLEAGRIDVNKDVNDAFKEGFDEGSASIRGTAGGTINSLAGTIAGILPWQIWLLAIGALVFAAWPYFAPVMRRR